MATLEETLRTAEGDGIEKTAVPLDADGTGTIDNDGSGQALEPITEPGGQTALVDRSQYEREDLAIDKVDGNAIDKIRLSFTGSIMLDRSDPNDVKLWNQLRLHKDGVTLMVEGRCSSTGAKGATNREGDLDVIVGEKSLKVETVYVAHGDVEVARSSGE